MEQHKPVQMAEQILLVVLVEMHNPSALVGEPAAVELEPQEGQAALAD